MKRVIRRSYGPSGAVLQVEDIELPPLGEDMVLVRVGASSLNTADSEHLRGIPRFTRLATGLRRPRSEAVGFDVSGIVESVGSQVKGLRPGDEIWADLFDKGHGAFAEYVWGEESAFAPKPARASLVEAAAVPHSGVLALQALRSRGPIGERVLVNGGGGCVGPLAIQIAKAYGAHVTAIDHTDKLELMDTAGADRVLDYTKQEITENGQRFDRILDIVGNRSVTRWRRCLNPGGRYVLIARSLGGFFRAAVLGAGISLVGDKRMGVFMWQPNRRSDLDVLSSLIDEGALTPMIDRHFALDDVRAAFEHFESDKARGKIIIIP